MIEELNRNEARNKEIKQELKQVQKYVHGNYKFEVMTEGDIFIMRHRKGTSSESVFMEPEAIDELIKWLNRIGYISIERLISQELSDSG